MYLPAEQREKLFCIVNKYERRMEISEYAIFLSGVICANKLDMLKNPLTFLSETSIVFLNNTTTSEVSGL